MFWSSEEEPFEAILAILGVFKMNPLGQERWTFRLAAVFRMTAILVIEMGSLMHFIKLVQEDVTEIDKSEDFTVFLGNISCYLVGHSFVKHRSDWDATIRKIVDFRTYGRPKGIGPIARRCNLLAKLWCWYSLVGVFVYATVAKSNAGNCRLVNEQRDLNLICGTFVPFHVSFYDIPEEMSPTVFWVQIVLGVVVLIPGSLVCYLGYEATQVLSAHLGHLGDLFEEIVDEGDARKLGRWVRYHVHILDLARSLNELFKITFNVIPLLSAVVIACVENQVIRTKSPGVGLFLLAYAMSLMLICHSGEQVESDSLRVADSIRDSRWYRSEARLRRSVPFLLMRAQKPIVFHTMPFGTLNYALYVMVIRASYSYMTLLNQTI